MAYKCAASIDGKCRNIYGFGAKCNGYSENCKLRNLYNKFENMFNRAEDNVRKACGIVPSEKGDSNG